MKEILRKVIFKYMNITVEDEKQNLLSLPVILDYWPYVLIELEEVYHFPVIQALEQMTYDEFTLEKMNEKLTLMPQ